MREGRRSSTAQAVALARAHLTEREVIDDPLARSLLTPTWSVLLRLLALRPLRRAGATATTAFLAARTLFFDDAVIAALDAGVRQVVTVGAGYDTRAWRLERPGTTWFEVDHPATQTDKRSRAPAGGPRYVPLDLLSGSIAEALTTHGLDTTRPTVFVVEGLTMYLEEPVVTALLADLARLGAPGSRLAVNFTVSGGGSVAPGSRLVAVLIRGVFGRRGEAFTTWDDPDRLPSSIAACGWVVDEVVGAPELARRHLVGTGMPTDRLSPAAVVVSARR